MMEKTNELVLYTAKPSQVDGSIWIVYDMYKPLPPMPIFIGSMEECGSIADAKNRPIVWDLSCRAALASTKDAE